MQLAIVGAGLIGRLLALAACEQGWHVTLIDKDNGQGEHSAGFVAAGMLAPYAEIEHFPASVFQQGLASLELWPAWLAKLPQPVYWQQQGSLLVAHGRDHAELQRMQATLTHHLGENHAAQMYSAAQIAELEPALQNRFSHGLYFAQEGVIHSAQLFAALAAALRASSYCDWQTNTTIHSITHPQLAGFSTAFDFVCDCRGLGAQTDLTDLRGVRGELVHVHAPHVQLHRPIRLLHPRYALYVVPYPEQQYVIGATMLESQDFSPISVQSTLELLSSLYSVHPSFGEARILQTRTQCRPAFPDNLPRVTLVDRVLRINGLYRHGYLLAPMLIADALQKIKK